MTLFIFLHPCPILDCQPRSVFQHIRCTQSDFRKSGEIKMNQHLIVTLYVPITDRHFFVRASSEERPHIERSDNDICCEGSDLSRL